MSDSNAPAVSFVVIAYNERHSIGACLEAVVAQAGGGPCEVVVVDDGSTDGTTELVQYMAAHHPEMKLIRHTTNQGRGQARATGIEAASGDLVAMIDSDIIIPPDWLPRAAAALVDNDAVGGVPVPDGDVTYLYNRFRLRPKHCPPTIRVSGTNGLYRRSVFEKTHLDPRLTEGEDVALNRSMEAAGLRLANIGDLIVEHRESKDFRRSLRWRFDSGVGATRQLVRYRQVRPPDVAVGVEVGAVAFGAFRALQTQRAVWLAIPLLGLVGVSATHVHRKFYVRPSALRFSAAVVANSVMFAAYCGGRIAGAVILARRSRPTFPPLDVLSAGATTLSAPVSPRATGWIHRDCALQPGVDTGNLALASPET